MSNHKTEPKTSKKFKKLVNNLNIELIKEFKKLFLMLLYLLTMEKIL